jgi:four helix bundle protein
MRPYRDLLAWQKAHALTLEIYRVTRDYPRVEQYGLISQTRRAAASVPANLAEGCGKRSMPQLRHSVDLASGSLSELEYWLVLARDLGYLSPKHHARIDRDLDEVRRLVLGLAAWAVRKLEEDDGAGAECPGREGRHRIRNSNDLD